LKKLKKELEKKSNEFSDVIKLGRTHLQDALPMTLGSEFSSFLPLQEFSQKTLKKKLTNTSLNKPLERSLGLWGRKAAN